MKKEIKLNAEEKLCVYLVAEKCNEVKPLAHALEDSTRLSGAEQNTNGEENDKKEHQKSSQGLV